MHVRIKLMGSLRGKQPAAGGSLEIDAGTTITSLLERLGVASGHIHLVMVNGAMERDRDRVLAEGDEVVVFPPVAGG